jgi:hypothetical protein
MCSSIFILIADVVVILPLVHFENDYKRAIEKKKVLNPNEFLFWGFSFENCAVVVSFFSPGADVVGSFF